MNPNYRKDGYFVVRSLFSEDELQPIKEVVLEFHELWKADNKEFYAERAINSAYLTSTEYLDNAKRNVLFQFIGSTKLMQVVAEVIPERPAFMNTQLFFNPVNELQKNYWHRDSQYGRSIEEQKQALEGPAVLHFRVPLVDEPGIELVPGTHRRWDTEEELNVRLETNGHKNFEDLSTGKTIQLNAGDLLVFSATMMHRGLYGLDRLALDILIAESDPRLMEFVHEDCLPDTETLAGLEDPTVFLNTLSY